MRPPRCRPTSPSGRADRPSDRVPPASGTWKSSGQLWNQLTSSYREANFHPSAVRTNVSLYQRPTNPMRSFSPSCIPWGFRSIVRPVARSPSRVISLLAMRCWYFGKTGITSESHFETSGVVPRIPPASV